MKSILRKLVISIEETDKEVSSIRDAVEKVLDFINRLDERITKLEEEKLKEI